MNKGIYFVLSVTNICFSLYLNNWNSLNNILVFSGLILVSQIMLVVGVQNLLSNEKSKKKSSLLVLKFFVIGFAFYFASQNLDEYLKISTIFYIFQLLILVISIKNNGSFKQGIKK